MTNVRTDDRHIVAVVLGGRSGASRDRAMAALVQANLPRAYAGARQVPMVAEAAPRLQLADVETTATAPARPGATTGDLPSRRAPLDLNAMRPAFASAPDAPSTTTPTSPPLKASAPALPSAAQTYAAASALDLSDLPPPPPGAKIQTRLPGPEVVVSRLDPPQGEPVRSERAAKPEPKAEAKTAARPDAAEPTHERLNRTVTGWVIQLGATDDETKAKEILEQARTRSGRVLSKAAAFTEKVVRDGTTLYRARFSGFAEGDSAHAACKTLKRSGFACFATRG